MILPKGTVTVEIKMKEVTFQDGQSGDPNLVMKEMVKRFLETEADRIPVEQWSQCLHYYLKGALHLIERQAKEGSLIISVQCKTLEILERLWDDYRCGHLNVEAEKRLLTDDIKERLNVESVKLETTILEEDYFICKLFLVHFSRECLHVVYMLSTSNVLNSILSKVSFYLPISHYLALSRLERRILPTVTFNLNALVWYIHSHANSKIKK